MKGEQEPSSASGSTATSTAESTMASGEGLLPCSRLSK